MKMFSARQAMARRNYRSDRMSKIRGDVLGWMQEYEGAKTAKHRDVCMDQIRMNLRKYEWYGRR